MGRITQNVVIGLFAILFVFISVAAGFLALISWFMSDWGSLAVRLCLCGCSLAAYWFTAKTLIFRISLSAPLRQKPTVVVNVRR